MATWKLRKDKTSTEEGDADSAADTPAETPATEPVTPEFHAPDPFTSPFADTDTSELPSFDSDTDLHTDLHFTAADFGDEFESLKAGDEPLTLVDYTEPALPAAEPIGTAAGEILPTPSPAETVSDTTGTLPPHEPEDFFQRLRTDRITPDEAPSADPVSGWSIPTVAPFVLDTPVPTATPRSAPQLIVRIGRLSATFVLTKEVTTIGRPDSMLEHYPDVEIEMDDAVSRRHAEIVDRPDGFYLVDTGSTNGTLLNGDALPPHQEHRLEHGDHIRLGDRTEIIFE